MTAMVIHSTNKVPMLLHSNCLAYNIEAFI